MMEHTQVVDLLDKIFEWSLVMCEVSLFWK